MTRPGEERLDELNDRIEAALALAQSAVQSSRGKGGLGVSEAALLDHCAACLRRLDLEPKAEVELLSRAMALDPANPARLFLLAEAQRRSGRGEDAIASFNRYLERQPDDVNALSNVGALLLQADRNLDAMDVLQQVIGLAPGHLQGWINLATAHSKLNRWDDAEAAYRRVLELDPANDPARRGLNNVYARTVPRWHFVMMNDRRRNEVYQAAIERAIRLFREQHGRVPLVLEIGAGSGLLPMMAARAGAEHVVACEKVRPVAEVATAIVARNGFSSSITVHDKKSSDLAVDFDGETFFDTGPYVDSTCWAQAVQVEDPPHPVRQGQTFAVRVSQTRAEIRFAFAGGQPSN